MFTHPVIPLAIGTGFGKKTVSGKLLVLGILFSILPDFDVIAFKFGIPYSSQWGHRGFTHSLFFAVVMSIAFAYMFSSKLELNRVRVFAFLFIAMASHGLLDMFTDGGLGIALLWPFDLTRYFWPHQVIKVSPIGMSFFSDWGLRTLISEFFWIWLPSLIAAVCLFAGVRLYRRAGNNN
jgi:inner membrane protein